MGKQRFELTTSMNLMDMPYQITAKDKATALKFIRARLRKGEKIVKLERIF